MTCENHQACDRSGHQSEPAASTPADDSTADVTHAQPLRVITVDRAIKMHPSSAADILDDLDGDLLRSVWDVLIDTLVSGEGHETDEDPKRAFYLEPGQEHILARQLLDFRDTVAQTAPGTAAELTEPEEGLRGYLTETVEVGYCRASGGEGGDWFSDYVQVPAGLDEHAKEAAAVRAGEDRAAIEGQEVAHVFVYYLDVPRTEDLTDRDPPVSAGGPR
jgi:hypothetical protein